MRYFLTLSYLGTRYCGWQRQPNGVSVQQCIETALSTLLGRPVEITGCGRTDAGVHARYYVAHFDNPDPLPQRFLQAINSLLPVDIAVQNCTPVASDAHARYDAFERSYIYTITVAKDPFLKETAWFYPRGTKLNFDKMQEVASILSEFEDFAPFCKSDSGLENFKCLNLSAHWEQDGNLRLFHISANRFLRGMVRLIVGACIYAGNGKIEPSLIRDALRRQTTLPMPSSVPPEGLALTAVKYPDGILGF